MSQVSIKNLNKPTSPIFPAILGTALVSENHTMGWISFGLSIVGGLIPIFTNGVPADKTPPTP